MAADTAHGGLNQLEEHYKTFIVSTTTLPLKTDHSLIAMQTEQDFAEIAGYGLNFVRIPLPYWAIEVRDNEPFLGGVAWK